MIYLVEREVHRGIDDEIMTTTTTTTTTINTWMMEFIMKKNVT
jgi:hypothetical protein